MTQYTKSKKINGKKSGKYKNKPKASANIVIL